MDEENFDSRGRSEKSWDAGGKSKKMFFEGKGGFELISEEEEGNFLKE